MFEPKVFREQTYCIEESTCDIVGLFGAPQWFGARGIVPPLSPLLTPLDKPTYFLSGTINSNYRCSFYLQQIWRQTCVEILERYWKLIVLFVSIPTAKTVPLVSQNAATFGFHRERTSWPNSTSFESSVMFMSSRDKISVIADFCQIFFIADLLINIWKFPIVNKPRGKKIWRRATILCRFSSVFLRIDFRCLFARKVDNR